MKSAGRCRFTDENGFCTNADMQGGGFRCLGPDCGGREPISGPKSDARIQQQADNSKKKEPKMKRPTYVMKKIALADCKPHADAEAYSASTEDRTALANSIGETGVLSPIAVIPDEEGKGWYVIDGIGRMNALVERGDAETEAQVFDLGDLTVAEFVVCKNAMMRKVTTGTRVMAYLKCHEREVLAAAEPEVYALRGRDAKGRISPAVSCETAGDKGWGAKEIAGRLGVSKNDVLAGIELLKASAECCQCENVANAKSNGQLGTGNTGNTSTLATFTQMDLFETLEAVMHGETPIRRWKAAAGGKVSKVGGKAAADYTGIGARTMVGLLGLFEHWQEVPMDCRGPIVERFKLALEAAPEDFRAAMEDWAESRAEAQGRRGKRR